MVNNGIPLWFRCFKGKNDPAAFNLSLIKDAISFVHNLFESKNCTLIFLADRWFTFRDIMQYIHELGDIYCIRSKNNLTISIDSVTITSFSFPTKLAISKTDSHKEPFIILTNGNTRQAIKHYGYRFGSIECIFKNQKSNRFLPRKH